VGRTAQHIDKVPVIDAAATRHNLALLCGRPISAWRAVERFRRSVSPLASGGGHREIPTPQAM
jgi:hypothetical protein